MQKDSPDGDSKAFWQVMSLMVYERKMNDDCKLMVTQKPMVKAEVSTRREEPAGEKK